MAIIKKKSTPSCGCEGLLFCDVCKTLNLDQLSVILNACTEDQVKSNWVILDTVYKALQGFCNVRMPEEVIVHKVTSKGSLPESPNISNTNNIAKILIYENASGTGIYYWDGIRWKRIPIPEICLSNEKKVVTGFVCIDLKLIEENCKSFDPQGIDLSTLTPCDIEVYQNGVLMGEKGNTTITGIGSTVKYEINTEENKIYFFKTEDETISESLGTIDLPCWIRIKLPVYETTNSLLSCAPVQDC